MADAAGLRRAVEQRGGFIARRLASDLDSDLHRAARRHRASGQMERAIKVTQNRTSPATWRVTADVPVIQAATTDRGARPHVIRPRNAKVLRFVSGGRVVYARVVNHPGNRPSRWFTDSISPSAVHRILTRFVGR